MAGETDQDHMVQWLSLVEKTLSGNSGRRVGLVALAARVRVSSTLLMGTGDRHT